MSCEAEKWLDIGPCRIVARVILFEVL